MDLIPRPEVTRCYIDASVAPRMSAMELRWHDDAPGAIERIWHLPEGVSLHSSAPTRFGINIERLDKDEYRVRLLWNHTFFAWNPLSRARIMTGSLPLILRALGSDLWQILDQPLQKSQAA